MPIDQVVKRGNGVVMRLLQLYRFQARCRKCGKKKWETHLSLPAFIVSPSSPATYYLQVGFPLHPCVPHCLLTIHHIWP